MGTKIPQNPPTPRFAGGSTLYKDDTIKVKLLKNTTTEDSRENKVSWMAGIYEAEIVEMNCVKITSTLYLRPEEYRMLSEDSYVD